MWTTFFPRYDLYQMIPSVIDDVDFSIENFTDSKKFNEKGLLFFKILVERYSQWIADSRKRADGLDDLYKGIARKNLNNCQRAVERMEQGVVLLGTNASAQNCFIKANQVMSLQHEWKKTGKIFRWHPFQIAFFLLNLQGLFDELSNDRKIADLLWFPTGGGKTEAYLLISAFSFLWRRERESLKQRWGGGTAIILRYTLRLLTQQQLQRAARMCCAAEFLRKADPATRGHSPISIGFWVGGDSFPNDNKKWEKMRIEGCAPMPLSSCPCCNSELAIANYRVRSVGGEINGNKVTRLSITCFEESCAFSKQQLPIYLTDEDLFRFSPTMVIGTVDKFANVAWSTKSGKLFNKYHLQCNIHGMFHEAEEKCSCRLSPILSCAPELIIQDELHLITGPLGSMVGAFEVAIRSLCKNGLAEPKYIASTATIRGAGRQLMELYRKEGFQFPPSGLESGDSFFAKKANQNDRSKIRTYVGISAQGRSSKLIAARLYAAISHFYQHHRNKSTFNSADLDYFRTVVGYFNSRKELGGVNTMLGDDVLKWRKYQHDIDDSSYPNAPLDVEELFGGISSEKVMKVMARMEMRNHKAPEFVLATNILSVGIDINRLVTMVIAGQPKTTSEYVQASSRVGRERAGIVFINYNWARARDRSHYEKFRSYHEQLYRFVEGVSVTPFSPEVRRRTLAGTLVSMLRHNTPDMWGDFGAINIHRCLSDVQRVKEEYLENIQDINTKIEVGREIDQFFETWKKKTDRSTTDFKYRASAKNRGVLVPFGIEADNFIDYFVNSLRNVDDEIPLSKM